MPITDTPAATFDPDVAARLAERAPDPTAADDPTVAGPRRWVDRR
jgi:hypothetical protein